MKIPGRRGSTRIVVLIVLCSAFLAPSLASHSTPQQAATVRPVPTEVCSCPASASATAPGSVQPKDQVTFSGANYDEQLGFTFTQSFTSLQYNVTAVEQTDPTLGDGPAYLLNGLSNSGYWYQVGVSWNWGPGQNPGTGFDMNYEVFNTLGNSVYPAQGGGLMAFSGPVGAGDEILLNIYFSNSTRQVVMLAQDTETGASASVSYSSEGASYFTGLPGSVANTNGFFTGLMTEWYHEAPYYANEMGVVYSNPDSPLSSAWMWVNEFNINSLKTVFSENTPSPVSYNGTTRLQEFSFNGTTEYSSAYELVTGELSNTTQSSGIPLTLSFSIQGGGTGYAPPTLSYVFNGTLRTATVTGSPIVYYADAGSKWSISATLGGSTSAQRWETDQNTTGVVSAPQTFQFVYYNQDFVTFGFTVAGGGTGYSTPSVSYTAFDDSSTGSVGVGVWVDAGSRYNYTNPLPGSIGSERWFANPGGALGPSHEVSVVYYNQYLVDFDLSFENTAIFPALTLRSTSADQPYSATVILGTNKEWLDAGANYSVPQSYSLESGERLITNGTDTGRVSAGLTVSLVYRDQFYLNITQNVPSGGTVSPESGWYDSGSTVQLGVTPSSGWQFEGWQGSGTDSASGSSPSLTMTVGPGSPANETAILYPGVAIDARGPISVSYDDGSISGSVPGGTTTAVFVPPSSTLNLTVSAAGFLTTFTGWRGAINDSGTQVSLLVTRPSSVTADSSYDYLGIAAVVSVAALVGAATLLILRRRGIAPQSVPTTPALQAQRRACRCPGPGRLSRR